jgi:hypothetical protein
MIRSIAVETALRLIVALVVINFGVFLWLAFTLTERHEESDTILLNVLETTSDRLARLEQRFARKQAVDATSGPPETPPGPPEPPAAPSAAPSPGSP